MPSTFINACMLTNAVFGFCQWLCYLSMLHLVAMDGLGTMPLYATIVLQYLPMALLPLLLKNKMETVLSPKWLFLINYAGIASATILVVALKLESVVYGGVALFSVSCLVGLCTGLFLALPAKLSVNSTILVSRVSRITTGYYLGNLVATSSVSFFSLHRQVHMELAVIGLALQILTQVALRFCFRTGVYKQVVTPSMKTFFTVLQVDSGIKWYLAITAMRYLSWGFIAFFFPLAVMQRFSKEPAVFAAVAAAATGCMMIMSLILSVMKRKKGPIEDSITAAAANVLNGVFVAAAYLAPSFTMFLACFAVAGFICIVADVKTCGCFIGLMDSRIRGRLSALTSSIRFAGLALGNVVSVIVVNISWKLGPILILSLLLFSGVAYYFLLSSVKARYAVANQAVA